VTSDERTRAKTGATPAGAAGTSAPERAAAPGAPDLDADIIREFVQEGTEQLA